MIDEKMLAMKAEKDKLFAQADEINERIRAIQLEHRNFDAGHVWPDGLWHEYFPHKEVKKIIKCHAVDHHNEWCDCKYCKEDHDKHYALIHQALQIYDQLKKYSLSLGNLGFYIRGMGLDGVKCFICGQMEGTYNDNISAFVNSKQDGEKIVSWFKYGWLDYRPSEPHYIQVKIGACKRHLPLLEKLCGLISWHGTIAPEIVQQVYTKEDWEVVA